MEHLKVKASAEVLVHNRASRAFGKAVTGAAAALIHKNHKHGTLNGAMAPIALIRLVLHIVTQHTATVVTMLALRENHGGIFMIW